MVASTPIAVVGVSAMYPGARSAREFWRNIVAGVDAVGPIPDGRLNGAAGSRLPSEHPAHWRGSTGGFLPNNLGLDAIGLGIPPTLVEQGDADQFFALALARSAILDSRLAATDELRARTDIVIGRGGYMSNRMADLYLRSEAIEHVVASLPAHLADEVSNHLYEKLPPSRTDTLETCMPNLAASRIANRMHLGGAAYLVDGACASSLLAVEQIVDRLRSHKCDAGIAMGLHLFQTPSLWFLFDRIGALSQSGSVRPFDRHADGLAPAEGGGAIVLRRLDDAIRDGQRIYALIRGVGVSSDGGATSVLNPDSAGQVRALEAAYMNADISPDRVRLVEAHGTATEAGDRAELETLSTVFGRRRGPVPSRCLGTVKSMIGHAMPAAGMAGLIKTIYAAATKVLPPTLHCESPRDGLFDTDFYVTARARPWIHPPGTPRTAGVNAFGFGGINAHVIVEEATESATAFWDAGRQPTQLFVAAATCRETLAATAARLASEIDTTADLEGFSHQSIDRVSEGEIRLGVVASSTADLSEKLKAASQVLLEQETALPDGTFVGSGDPDGKLAFVFPGVGFPGLIGNYPSHLMTMAMHFPVVREVLDAVEERDREPQDPTPTSLILLPPDSLEPEISKQMRARVAALPVDTKELPPPSLRNISTSCVTVTHWLSFALLRSMGVVPAMICGQSQGELAALVAGGILDVNTLVDHAWENLDVAASYSGDGRLAYAGTNERRIKELLTDLEDVDIAIHVSRDSQILAGSDRGIAQAIEILRNADIMAQGLPYPPIHSKQLSGTRTVIDGMVPDAMDLRTASTPVYSAITTRPFPEDPAAIRELALSNIDRPVRFWQTIRAMYDDGARVFVQSGGGTLAANIDSILSDQEAATIALDTDHRHPITQLQLLMAELFARGYAPDLSELIRHRQSESEVECNAEDSITPFVYDRIPLRPESERGHDRGLAVADGPDIVADGPNLVADGPDIVADGPASYSGFPLIDDLAIDNGSALATHRYDLSRDLFLHDHVLIGATEVKPIEACFPVVPLTVLLESMAEAAAALAPGYAFLGFENLIASRWVALRDVGSLDTRIEATLLPDRGDGAIAISTRVLEDGDESARAVVLFGDDVAPSIELTFAGTNSSTRWPFTPVSIYEDRHLFHGPRFRCVRRLGDLGSDGCTGSIELLPTDGLFRDNPTPQLLLDPVAFDGALQISGLFVMGHHQRLPLPTSIAKLELYGPRPETGSELNVRIGLVDLDMTTKRVTTNLEVLYPEGDVWLRIAGYQAVILDYSENVSRSQRAPKRYLSSTEIDVSTAGVTAVSLEHEDLRNVNLEWLARFTFNENEWPLYAAAALREQWQMVREYTAVKDAARRRFGGDGDMPHPCSLIVEGQGPLYRVRANDGRRCQVRLDCRGTTLKAVAMDSTGSDDMAQKWQRVPTTPNRCPQ